VGTILRTYQRGDSILRKQGILERTPFRKPREIQWPRAPYETTQRARVLEAADVGSDVRTYVLAAVDGQLPSMAHQLRADIRDFDLHVCARDADSVPFGPVLGELPFADRVHVHLDTAAGRSSLSAADVLGRWDGSAALYLCGPVGFMDWVATQAVGLGWPGGVIHRESFTAPIYDIRDNAPFEVVLARSGTTLAVPADRQILDVLIEHEVPIRWGCSQGVCGTCVTTVLDGEPEHRDAVLSPAARAANTAMCVCVSRANCPRIVLDL
jgi:vanillate O-demethylase ferredoxin subunit